MRYERLPLNRTRQLSHVQLVTILLLSLVLGPPAARALALGNMLALTPADYLKVQHVDQGSSLCAMIVVAALVFAGIHTYIVRDHAPSFRWSLAAGCCLALSQLLHWMFIVPTHEITQGWTAIPPGFEMIRAQVESTYGARFVLDLAALGAFVMSVQAGRPCLGLGILDAIGEDIRARNARARALAASAE
jgi:hypothetical protein